MISSEIKKVIRGLDAIAKADYKTTNSWILTFDSNRGYRVRRIIVKKDGKRSFQNLPAKYYKEYKDNENELNDFVTRLNNKDPKEVKAKNKYESKTAFIPSSLLQKYYSKLESEIDSEKVVRYTYRYTKELFIDFFVELSPDPVFWYRDFQPEWSKFLIKKNYSISVLKKIINSANRFTKFLHEERPEEIPLMVFQPISPSRMKIIKSNKELAGEGSQKRNYISETDYQIILDTCPELIKSIIQIGYLYGLRRNEILALFNEEHRVRKGYLLVDKQLYSKDGGGIGMKPTKNRMMRKVNHWFCSAQDCYSFIKQIEEIKPDHLTRLFDRHIKDLMTDKLIKNKYVLHDLRHTYITNAVQKYNINDVSRCVGHSDISVTNVYLKDSRDLDDEIFIPEI